MGVTNISFDLFKSTIEAHADELAPYIRAAQNGEDTPLEDLWYDLDNPGDSPPGGGPSNDVRLSLAVTALILADRRDQFAAIDSGSLSAVPGVTAYEWSIQSYRYSLEKTIVPTARGTFLWVRM